MAKRFLSPRQTRRDFLKKTAVTSLIASSPSLALSQGRRVQTIGLQLYSLRAEMAEDFEGTLEQLAQLGFKEMEFAGYHGKSPMEVRRILDSFGLVSPAAHIQLNAVRENLEQEIETAATIGQQYIVVPSIPANERSLSDYERHADTLNSAGEKTKEAGIQMGYHNHSFEFETPRTGKIGYDYLTYLTQKDLVVFEMDLFWVVNAGHDPVTYFLQWPGRFPMLHVKDRNNGGEMVDVGRGVIDFAQIFTHAETAGFEHYFIEHDYPTDGVNSIAFSYNTLNNIRY